MEGLKVALWLLLCWTVYSSSRGGERDSRNVEEYTNLTMICHPETTAKYTTRYWYRINTTKIKGTDDPDEIFKQYENIPPEKRKAHRAGMTCDETSFELTINSTLLEDSIFTCITDIQGTLNVTQHPINVYRIGKLEMTGLENDTYKEDGVVNVSCTYFEFYPEIAKAKLNITWLPHEVVTSKNATAADDKYFTYEAKTTRTLMKNDNNTQVICSVTPTVGTAPDPVEKILNVHYSPSGKFELVVNDSTPYTYQAVEFTCTYTRANIIANPNDISVEWDNPMNNAEDWDGQRSVVITEVNSNNNGTYSCYLSNNAGRSIPSSKVLQVKDQWRPQEPPTMSFSNSNPYHSDPVNFTCEVEDLNAKPDVYTKVMWYLNGTTLDHWPKDTFTNTMIIDSKHDSGYYSCLVENTVGPSPRSPPSYLDVSHFYRASEPPTLTITKGTPKQGETVTFTCNATNLDANPNVSLVNWTREGVALIDWPSKTFEYTIRVTSNDSGDFSCSVGNLAGYSPYSNPTMLNVTEFYAPYSAPSLTTDKEVYRQNDVLTFNCSAEGIDANPKVDKFKWTKNGIQKPAWKTFNPIIHNLESDKDNGTYECCIGNDIGFSPSGGTKEIRVSPFYGASGKPRLTIQPNNATTGDEVTFTCDLANVQGNPQLVRWKYNSTKLSHWPADRHYTREVKENDTGVYACYVHNHLGDSESSDDEKLTVTPGSNGGGGDKPSSTAVIGSIVGAIVVIVFVVTIVAIVLAKKRRTKPDNSSRTNLNGTEMEQRNNGHGGVSGSGYVAEDDYSDVSPPRPTHVPRGQSHQGDEVPYANLNNNGQPYGNQGRFIGYGIANAEVNKPKKVNKPQKVMNDEYAEVMKPGRPPIAKKPLVKPKTLASKPNDGTTVMYAELDLPKSRGPNKHINQAIDRAMARDRDNQQPRTTTILPPFEELPAYAQIDFDKSNKGNMAMLN